VPFDRTVVVGSPESSWPFLLTSSKTVQLLLPLVALSPESRTPLSFESVQTVPVIVIGPCTPKLSPVSVALLNARGNGVVLTAIQDRDYARIYVKELRDGVADLELAPEERRAVEAAGGAPPSGRG